MLSNEIIRQLSSGGEKEYIFDFSLISSDVYQPLFRTLQKFCVTSNVNILGFNCDALIQHKNDAHLPPDITGSIAKRKKSYVRNMIELLCFCVPRSKHITEIRFSNLVFTHDHFTRMCSSFSRSSSLKNLIIQQCSIQDSSADSLFRILNPDKIEIIVIDNCNLESSVITSALAFIRKKSVPENEGIQTLSLHGNRIPQSELSKIDNALHPPLPIKEAIMKVMAQEEEPKEENDETEERSIYSYKIESLRNENQMLRNQIKALREMKASAELNGSIFVVGTGSPQFVSYLSEIEEKLIEIDQNTKFMPTLK